MLRRVDNLLTFQIWKVDSLLQLTKYWDGYVISRIDKIVAVHMYDSENMTTDSEVICTSSDIMNTQYTGWDSLQLCTSNYWNDAETQRTLWKVLEISEGKSHKQDRR